MWRDVPFACQRRPIIGVLRMCWFLPGSFDCFCCQLLPPLLLCNRRSAVPRVVSCTLVNTFPLRAPRLRCGPGGCSHRVPLPLLLWDDSLLRLPGPSSERDPGPGEDDCIREGTSLGMLPARRRGRGMGLWGNVHRINFPQLCVNEVGQTGTTARHNSQNGQKCCHDHSLFKGTVHTRNNFPCSMMIPQIARRRAAASQWQPVDAMGGCVSRGRLAECSKRST